jgi:hypothetical protein
MKNILIFLFICFGFALNSQITITCYECKKNTTVDCKGCNIQSNLFTGIVIKEKGKPDIPLYEPYKVSNKSSVFTFEDAFGTKTIVNVTSVLSYNTPKKLYDYLSNCLCKPSTIDTDTDRYSVLIQDSILVTYDINGVEIDRDTIDIPNITEQGNFRISNDTLYHNNSIDGIEQFVKLPSIDTTTQSYLPILNGLDTIGYENIMYLGGVEVDRDTIDYQLWYEKRICLNTATPSFTPADPNNPTITEIEAWKNANLSLLDQQNGTILTYYDPTPIYTIQPTLTINNPNSGVSAYSYRITSCIINSTELLTAPIDVRIADSHVYTGQIGTLIRNYFTSNNIIGQVDDGAFGEYNDVLIYGVQGSTLTISMTTEYSLDATPTTFVTTTVSGTTTAALAPQVYNCDTPLFTFILNKDNTVSKISQPQSLFFKEQTIIDAGIDKYGRIYRYGNIGIGMNRPKAPLHILGVGDQYEPYLSDAAIYIGGNGKKIYWGDNLKTPESTANVHNLSLGEWNGDSDAFAFHAKQGHRFYVKASAWDDNNLTQYPAFFIRNAVSFASNVGKIGLNTNNPRVSVDFGNLTNPDGIITNKDGMIIPGGTVAERPATPIAGTIRFNSDTSKFEGYTGTTWVDLH